LAGKAPNSHFEQGRWVVVGANSLRHSTCEWRVVVGRQSLQLAFRAREGVVGTNLLCRSNREWEVVVGREGLPLTFRASEVVVVGHRGHESPLSLESQVEGGSWQGRPPTRISSERGGGGGRKSPPSLTIRVEGCELAGKPSNSRFERGRGCGGWAQIPVLESQVEGWLLAGKAPNSRFERGRWWWSRIPSVTRIASGGGGAWKKPDELADSCALMVSSRVMIWSKLLCKLLHENPS
jgi:hypothetical protein